MITCARVRFHDPTLFVILYSRDGRVPPGLGLHVSLPVRELTVVPSQTGNLLFSSEKSLRTRPRFTFLVNHVRVASFPSPRMTPRRLGRYGVPEVGTGV